MPTPAIFLIVKEMVVFPNCKINLGLDILRKRPDGYHDLRSIFVPVAWHDVLEAVPLAQGSDSRLTVTGNPCDCPTEKNLVMKALRALEAYVGRKLPTDIYLHKVIPDGAGLGGGSSDAAYMLMLLNDLYALGLSKDVLAGIAATVGADCPFFIYNTPMLATDTGTTLTPVDIPGLAECDIVVVKPRGSVSTAQAYAGVAPAETSAPAACDILPAQWTQCLKNDFEDSVTAQVPEIAEVRARLEELSPLYVQMSGSGSAVFAIFNRGEAPDSDALKLLFPGLASFSGHIAN